jgi:hypothetical protein
MLRDFCGLVRCNPVLYHRTLDIINLDKGWNSASRTWYQPIDAPILQRANAIVLAQPATVDFVADGRIPP